jgi:hypothetical protein
MAVSEKRKSFKSFRGAMPNDYSGGIALQNDGPVQAEAVTLKISKQTCAIWKPYNNLLMLF